MRLPGVSGFDKEHFKEVILDCVPEAIQEKRPEEVEVEEMVAVANVLYERLIAE